jgi:hypothetical protein
MQAVPINGQSPVNFTVEVRFTSEPITSHTPLTKNQNETWDGTLDQIECQADESGEPTCVHPSSGNIC